MAEINTKKETKNLVELKNALEKDGITVETIVINGHELGVMGSTSEKDRQGQLKALELALETVEDPTNVWQIQKAIMNMHAVAIMKEHDVDPDEQVEVNGRKVFLQYAKKNAVTLDGEVIATIEDLPDLPTEAAKTILIERVKLADVEEDEDDED